MKRNITLRIDERLLKQCKHIAIESDKSLSEWVAYLMASIVVNKQKLDSAKKQALKYLDSGLSLGGKPLSRDQTHER